MAVAALSLATSLGAPAAHADDDGLPSAAAIAALDATHLGERPPGTVVDAALAQAKADGKDVPVLSLTTEYSETVATPDGHLRESRQVEPQRMKRDGTWIPLDATLTAGPDGTLSPTASSSVLTLSGGGAGPLAVMTNAGGQQLSITAPFALPAPTTTGDSALYPNVAPDTDLKVTVTKEGGFSTVLIVKTPAAAANPALRKLSWPTAAKGVKVSADSSGNISALDDTTGKPVFTAPTPIMWDSRTTTGNSPSTGTGAKAMARSFKAAAAPSDSAPAPVNPVTPPPGAPATSSASGPGAGAAVAAMPVAASNGTVDLTPSQDLLTDPGTRFPVYIDPSWSNRDANFQAWAWTESADPTRVSNGSTPGVDTNHLGVGQCGTRYPNGDPCTTTTYERSYYQFDVRGWHNALVNSATLKINEYSSADHSCTQTYPVSAYATTAIDGNTSWSNKPADGTLQETRDVGGSGGDGCYGNVPVYFNVTPAMSDAAKNSRDLLTFGIYGDQDNPFALKYFNASPALTVVYDLYPNIPTNLHTAPSPPRIFGTGIGGVGLTTTDVESCADVPASSYGWINTDTTALQSTVSTPTQPAPLLNEWAHIWDNTVPTDLNNNGWGNPVPNGGTTSYQLPANSLKDGHYYGWYAFTNDGIAYSPTAPVCHFAVDLTPPTLTLPSENDLVDTGKLQLPPSGNGQDSPIHTGETGYIKFQANDAPDPHGNGKVASGIAALRWSYDPAPAPNWGWVSPTWVPGGASAGINATGLPVRATHWGTNVIYVQVMDRAGNISASTAFSFYVPWSPVPLAYGDFSGDARPDVLAPAPNGDLLDYSQALTFSAPATVPGISGFPNAPGVVATKDQAPPVSNTPDSRIGWNKFRISHRGSKDNSRNVDDVFAHQDPNNANMDNGGPDLTYLKNSHTLNGTFTKDPTTLNRPLCQTSQAVQPTQPIPAPNCGPDDYGPATSWATVSQITPIGSPTTTLTPDGKFTNATGLLVIEKGNLWYYPAGIGQVTSPTTIADFASPIQLTTDRSWGNYDLIVPGDALDTKSPATPTLWVRARSDAGTVHAGDIYQYALEFGTATDKANPTGYTIVTKIDQYPATPIGTGVTVQDWPVVGAASLTSDDVPDLWARGSTTNQITTWAGVTDPSKPGAPVVAFTRRDDQWTLSQTRTDANNFNNLTVTDPVSWGTPLPSMPGSTGSLRLDGGMATAAGTAVDTKSAYTVSAWVKLDNVASYQTFVSQAGTNTSAFYLQYNKALNAWTFLTTSTDSSGATQYIAHSNPQAVSGNWTHLVGTYTPGDTKGPDGSLTLYVNGEYAGSAGVPNTDQNSWSASGPLTIGGVKLTGGATSNQVHGNIADVRTYPYVLTKEQVKTIYNNQ
ncbi:LamG-like jellyroll fold domain-containing protein [Kitasatospora sp. MMS16-BH015]|uniref:LamG-like jellyroll fold domain-containing protein n=1 Tax=Kitasatospora sp. MMS16-BH015 TaxID=2018025 RepID=UPI00131A49AD|nr:LamG-like jellyroll fold domain-containing protein [Kitasatospora sp. MMS16-BH015]